DLLQGLGVRFGGSYVPQYQDLNWKFDVGKGRHRVGFFGLVGQSHILVQGKDVDPENPYHPPTEDSELSGHLLVTGLRHQVMLDSVSYWRTVVSFSSNRTDSKGWNLDGNGDRNQWLDENDLSQNLRLSSLWQRRHTKRLTLRAGVLVQSASIDTRLLSKQETPDYIPVRDYDGQLWLLEAFAQMQYKVKKR